MWTGTGRLEVSNDGDTRGAGCEGNEVRIRVTAAGFCATDVHIIRGQVRFVDPPLVLGHEIAGVVEECGEAVSRLSPGDRVKCDSVIGCGICGWCAQGATQFCKQAVELGITCDGGWAEWLVVPERALYRLPDALPDEVAAILDVEVYGALSKPGVCPGDTVVIFGPGPAGLIALQLARIMGATTVILCGTRNVRLQLGQRLGADYIVNVTERDPVALVRQVTGGKGADLAFEAAGSEAACLEVLQVLRPQGKAVFYGVHGRPLSRFPIDQVVLKDLNLYGALSNRTGWNEIFSWVLQGKLDLQSLITRTLPLDQASLAYELLNDPREEEVKIVFSMG